MEGRISLTVETSPGCPWAVELLPSWVTAAPMSGSGSSAVTLTVGMSTLGIFNRIENVRVAGRLVTVTQGGLVCKYTTTPLEVHVPAGGGRGTFEVTGSYPMCTLNLSTQPWVTLTNAAGVGSWVVSYDVAPNPSKFLRWTTLSSTPLSSLNFFFYQEGRNCVDSVSPLVINAPAEGGIYSIDVTTIPGPCNWAGLAEGGFIFYKTSPYGSTNGSFSFEVRPNTGPMRRGSIRVSAPPSGVEAPVIWTVDICQVPAGSDIARCNAPVTETHVRYLAEGTTSAFFDTRLAVLNPGDIDTTATIVFGLSTGIPISTQLTVPARRRLTLDPKSVPRMAEAEFSTMIESDRPLVVDRTMSWNVQSGYGAHAETSVAAPARTWYLAEGSTVRGFNLFYLFQNPNTSPAQVRARYLRPTGAPLEKMYTLVPSSRSTIWVNLEDFPGLGKALAASDVSAVIEVINDQPIIVERAMYLDVPGQTFGAGHESAGVTAPATEWFLAEGATGPFFDLFALVANPGPTDAQIEATYLLPDGTVVVLPYTVAANSRFNIWVDLEHPALANTAVSTIIRSVNGVPIIVERAMWWPEGGWYEAHNSPGATTTGTKWALAEGEVGGARGVETYILLANTSPTDGEVTVTLLFEDGTSAERTFTVAARSRFNVDARHEFPAASNRRFGAIVESRGSAPVQLVVERAMYWNAAGKTWAAGTNALATRLR